MRNTRHTSEKKTETLSDPETSRTEILDFIATEREAGRSVGKREIARAFGITGGGKIWLKKLLKEIDDEAGEADGKPLLRKAHLPPVVLADITARDRDGDLIAEPVDWDIEVNGPRPRIVIHIPRKPKPDAPVAGVGERALIRVERNTDSSGPGWTGRVVKILKKERAQVLGIFRPLPDGSGRLVPIDKKSLGRELIIPRSATMDARDGDLVAVSVSSETRFGPAQARVRELLGSIKSEKAVSLIAIQVHNIRNVFPDSAIAESEAVSPAKVGSREDWRELALITIDPADAKDHDDAVHATPDTDENNPGGFVVTVAIADVAAYVTPGSALDSEALLRGNSVYFPDRVVPMLPERISNDLCSLRPHENRPALALRMVLRADGMKLRHAFHRILMRSSAKLSYVQAQEAINGNPDETTKPLLEQVLKPLWAAYACASKARDIRQPLALDLPERKLLLKEDGSVDRVLVPERLDAHRLIEEFMILANVCAAETLERAGSPLLYRAHDEPSLEKMRNLGEVLASVGIKLPKQGALRPEQFNRILAHVKSSENETFINEIVLRSQAQALYSAENLGHFGLNLRRYAHFTSPIRRYADLIVHRALIAALKLGDGGLPKDTTPAQLRDVAEQISAAERRAMAAERDTIDRLIAWHLADQIGASFEGRVGGVTRSGLFVKLDTTGADGFVPAATLGADYYAYDEATHALIGQRSGESWRLGDRVTVKLVEAAPVAGALRFEILSEGRMGAKPSGHRSALLRRGGGGKRSGGKPGGFGSRKRY
jgi:ribonuclease R